MDKRELQASLECYVYNPLTTADASIIWLHGLGANAEDFVGIIEQLGLGTNYNIRFVFPNAPEQPITVNNGLVMRAWYDIYELNMLAQEDSEGIKKSQALLEILIQDEITQGISANRIILAGFSQGGAIALYTGLRARWQLGGIISLSTYNPLSQSLISERSQQNQNIPIFLAHGLFDPIVPFNLGQIALRQLQDLNYTVNWHSYPMQHTVSSEEINDIGNFIKDVYS